jgi:hypothetical protein
MPTLVELDRDEADGRFADAAGIRQLLDEVVGDGTSLSQGITERLERLAALKQNALDGGLSVRFRKRHIKLKRALWDTAVTGTIAALSAAEPTPLTKGAAAAKVLDYLVKFTGYVQELSASEVYVYDALVAATEHMKKGGRVLRSDYPSQNDIEQLIRSRDEEVPENLKDVLDSLAAKGGVAVVFENDGLTRYRRVI